MESQKRHSSGIKPTVVRLLVAADREETLEELLLFRPGQIINPLFSFLSRTDQLLRWRAVTAMGIVVAHAAGQDMEWARVVMRRLIWSLNDESGGIGWGAPEAMGEIMARHEGLAREYASILVSYVRRDGNFLEHVPLQRGALWALGRLAQTRPAAIGTSIPHLLPYLESSDAPVRGLAVWTLGLLRAEGAQRKIQDLLKDSSKVELYADYALSLRTVGGLAQEALSRIAALPSQDD